MNLSQYQKVCEVCDSILMAPDATLETVAIPWLHVVREHPVFLRNYQQLFETSCQQSGVAWKQCVRMWLTDVRSWVRILRDFVRNASTKKKTARVDITTDVLFVSHFLNASQVGAEEDFYFGDLPQVLSRNGMNCAVALINHSSNASLSGLSWAVGDVVRYLLPDVLSPLDEFRLRRRLRKESVRLRYAAKKTADKLEAKAMLVAACESLSSGAKSTLRVEQQIADLTARLKPKAVVIIHEGHAWERMVFAAARETARDIRCIGYHHASLFRFQHAIRRDLKKIYNPDVILTAGKFSQRLLAEAPGLHGKPVRAIGSNRSQSPDLPIAELRPAKQGDEYGNICLVMPEGIFEECDLMFEFSIQCARLLPEVHFVWRLHPVHSFEALLKRNPNLRSVPRNVSLSSISLDEDIEKSRWTLYRGTTAVIKAVGSGSRPIYLERPEELSIDPLYDLGIWRLKVATADEFVRAVRLDAALYEHAPGQRDAISLCSSYFETLNAAVLIDVLESAHVNEFANHVEES